MPRKSAAELASGRSLGGITTRLRPPLSLQGPAREVFLRTVSTCRPDHFQAVDLPLLIQFSTATVLAAEATQQLADEGAVIDTDKGRRPSPWLPVRAQAAKELVQLSARLRICPQSRQANNPTRPSTAAPTANYLELMALREADDDDEVGPQ